MEPEAFQKQHINAVLELSNIAIGQGYLTIASLNKYINSAKYIGFVVLRNGDLVGFTLIDLLTPLEVKKTVLKDHEWFYTTLNSYDQIVFIKQTVVSSKYSNQGIGSQLVQHSTKILNAKKNIHLSTVWQKENSGSMPKVLMKNGFLLSKIILNYWKNDSLVKKYDCPICGRPPCKCATEVWIKKKH